MSGVLGEIAAAKSLAEDLYNCLRRLKTAGADIGDLDLKLRNNRFLLLRYQSVLSQRLALLHGHEISHLKEYFRAISRVLLDCTKKIESYEKKGVLGQAIWCVFGNETQKAERKVADWITGLMDWTVAIDADQSLLARKYHSAPQLRARRQQSDVDLQQAKSFDYGEISSAGQRRLLEHPDDAASVLKSSNGGLLDQNAKKDNIKNLSSAAYSMPAPKKVRELVQKTLWNNPNGHRGPSEPYRPVTSIRRIRQSELTPSKPTSLDTVLDETCEVIGSGTFGTVYKFRMDPGDRVRDPNARQDLACKEFRASDSSLAVYRSEVATYRSLKHCSHDHIIPLLHAWEEEYAAYMLFPLAQGDLRSLLNNVPPKLGRETEQWLLTQMTGIVSATCSIHKNIRRHRDLKPENILIFHDEKEGGSRWLISDFGTSGNETWTSGTKSASHTVSDNARPDYFYNSYRMGATRTYQAPREIERNHDKSVTAGEWASADIWALGCIFLEALAWYFQPPGYNPRGFPQSRVQTIQDDRTAASRAGTDTSSVSFWFLYFEKEPVLSPSVRHWLQEIRGLAKTSEWLLDIPYHIPRLLEVRHKARVTASELESILQHNLALKKMALGCSVEPYSICNGGPLPRADLRPATTGAIVPDTAAASSTEDPLSTNVKTTRTLQNLPPPPRHTSTTRTNAAYERGNLHKSVETPALRRIKDWSRGKVRSEYLGRGSCSSK